MPGYSLNTIPPLAPHFQKAFRWLDLQWEEWETYENSTFKDIASSAFEEGVVNAVFRLYRAERISWEDVLQFFKLAPFEKDDKIRELYDEWVKHTPLLRMI